MDIAPIPNTDDEVMRAWMAALESRHLADLRVPEVTRALRALSSAYVERRRSPAIATALDSAGKRAAYALFYAPLHFLGILHAVRRLAADRPAPAAVLDIGCGTGAAGAAWAVAAGSGPAVRGIDRHPWAVAEARWTYRHFGLRGHAQAGGLDHLPFARGGTAVIAAYVMNELPAEPRVRLETSLIQMAARGARVMVVEPIARSVTPWWPDAVARVEAAGGRADEWRFHVELPPTLLLFDKAAGLDHRELTLRTLYLPGHSPRHAA